MEEPSQSASSQLCRNGCGFYGTAQNEGMCSKCYKETVQKNSNSGRKSPSPHPLSSVKTDIPTTTNNLSSKERHSEVAVSSSMAALATSDSLSKSCSEIASTSNATPAAVTTSLSHVPTMSDIKSSSANQEDNAILASSTSASSPVTPSSDDSPSKPKRSRCATCRKRVGLTGFNCRCGKVFCGIHRYSDQHNCDYDYRADAQAKIRKENPVVVGEKVQKI